MKDIIVKFLKNGDGFYAEFNITAPDMKEFKSYNKAFFDRFEEKSKEDLEEDSKKLKIGETLSLISSFYYFKLEMDFNKKIGNSFYSVIFREPFGEVFLQEPAEDENAAGVGIYVAY